MLKNVQRWVWQKDKNGKNVLVAIPFDCDDFQECGSGATYGIEGPFGGMHWFCTRHWIISDLGGLSLLPDPTSGPAAE